MSHQIDESNGRDNMAYTGKTPWHGLGQQLNPDSTLDEWKIAAGLDWHIQKRPIMFGARDAEGNMVPKVIKNRFAHVRSDTQEEIGIGSDRFQLMQPGDTLEFYRDLVEGSRFTIETAGSLNGGSKIWALAKCNLDLTISGNDHMKSYVLLATANDGTMSTTAGFNSVRVVCNNTLTMAVGSNEGKAAIKVPHSRQFDANQVKSELGLIDERLEAFANDADTLARAHISDEQVIKYFIGLYAKVDDKDNVSNEKTLNRVTSKLLALYRSGPGAGLESARGTMWGAVNAVTNHVDFSTRARSDENRFNSGQFGTGALLKATAFNKALKIAA